MVWHRPWSSQLVPILIVATGLVALGCKKSKPTDTSEAPPPLAGPGGGDGPGGPSSAEVLEKLPGGEEFTTGKRVYANNRCANCHRLGETGGGRSPGPMGGPPGGGKGPGGGMNGPNLTAVGGDPAHTKEWIAEHVRNPRVHKPMSRMPPSGPEKISDTDLEALAAYLASRK